jgi:hypothetical protein
LEIPISNWSEVRKFEIQNRSAETQEFMNLMNPGESPHSPSATGHNRRHMGLCVYGHTLQGNQLWLCRAFSIFLQGNFENIGNNGENKTGTEQNWKNFTMLEQINFEKYDSI